MAYVMFPYRLIPIIGEARTPAELVRLLRQAHLDQLAAAEHNLDVGDRFVAVDPPVDAPAVPV